MKLKEIIITLIAMIILILLVAIFNIGPIESLLTVILWLLIQINSNLDKE